MKEETENKTDNTQFTGCSNEASVSSGDPYVSLLLASHDSMAGCGDEGTVAGTVYLDVARLSACPPSSHTGEQVTG